MSDPGRPSPGREITLADLESHVRGRTRLTEASVPVGGETFRITHPVSADALFVEEEFERDDERMPYWADLWPSALALSERLSHTDLSGKRTVELGCGVGLPSVVALHGGAEVLATDHYAPALDFAAFNAKANTGRGLDTRILDWREPPEDIGRFEVVLAADVLYERRNVSVMADLVQRLLSDDGEMLLADPARPGGSFFIEEMDEREYIVEPEETTAKQDGREITVMVYRITRDGQSRSL